MTINKNYFLPPVLLLILLNTFCATPEEQLRQAIITNQTSAVKELLESNTKINLHDIAYNRIFFRSRWNSYSNSFWENTVFQTVDEFEPEIIKLLIKHGADINAKDDDGKTALVDALSQGYFKIVKCLVDHGADVNAKKDDGQTVLMSASTYGGDLEIVKHLVDHGSDVNAKSHDGKTVLMSASHDGYLNIVTYLVSKNANVNSKDKDGNTALTYAAKNNHLEIVVFLMPLTNKKR